MRVVQLLTAVVLAAGLALACQTSGPQPQRTFSTPEAAMEALLDVIERDDQAALLDLFGHDYEDEIVTPDWDANRANRQEIAAEARDTYRLEEVENGVVEAIIGSEAWPMAIPLIRLDGKWRFDTAAGLEELLNRRIGRNELAAIAIMRAYVDAQIEYALDDRDGNDVLEYAQRLTSSAGKRDGLYWESEEGEPLSPFGPLVIGAESYLDTLEPGDPIRGYYFKVLTRQGKNPPGGRYSYVINGHMIAGFGLVAYPAEYGNSGVMTFVVNHRSIVQQKDLGEFSGMDEYDPEDTWMVAED